MVAIPWNLTGTEQQQAIVRQAFARIHFPFDRLQLPGTPELGWRDLNSGDDSWWSGAQARKHEDHHPAPAGDRPEPLNGAVEGRKWIMGVFFPVSARIYIDTRLEQWPELAYATIGAEIAHAVDEFLPLTDAQRAAIIALHHPDGPDDHTWWEKSDYGAEYYELVGEAFMRDFVAAYADFPFGDATDFAHPGINLDPADIRRIIGVERTDLRQYTRYGSSLVYHALTHRAGRATNARTITDTAGLRPCKVCDPI